VGVQQFYNPKNAANLLVAPLVLWLAILALVAFNLKGASFLVIPVIFGLISLYVLMHQKEPSLVLMSLLSFPMLFIMAPMLKMFPVGLGFFQGDSDGIQITMKIVSMVLVVLMFGLLLPVFGFFRHKNRWAFGIFVISLILLLSANFNSDFTNENPKPNSMVYALNADDDSAIWATYDNMLDDWTMNYLSDDPDQVNNGSDRFASKYGSGYTFTKTAIVKPIPTPFIDVKRDTIIGDSRHINLFISPQRAVNRMELFADKSIVFKDFNINGMDVYKKNEDANAFENRWRNRLFSFYVSDNDPLILEFTVPKDQKTVMTIYEASFDLLTNPLFTVPKRQDNMMPKPFVLNDAVLVKKTITIE